MEMKINIIKVIYQYACVFSKNIEYQKIQMTRYVMIYFYLNT